MLLAAVVVGCTAGPVDLPDTLPPLVPAGNVPVSVHAGPIVPGQPAPLVVRNVLPTEAVFVAWTSRGLGFGGCDEPALLGACVDLVDPEPLIGPLRPDLSRSLVTGGVFEGILGGDTVWLQAFVVSGDVVTRTRAIARPVFDADAVWPGSLVLDDPRVLDGITGITGDVIVEATALDVLELPDLVQIGGHLRIWENDALVTLGLPELRFVGGDLSLYDNLDVDVLQGFSALETVGGTLAVNRMSGLVDLQGLEALSVIGQGLYVFHSVNLRSLDGLSGLRSIGLAAELWELYGLERVNLPAVEGIGGRLDLFDADALTTVSLPTLQTMGGYELHHCDAMTDVGAFDRLTTVHGAVILQYNDALRSVAGFGALTTVGAFSARFDDALEDLDGLTALTAVDGPLELYRLKTLVGLGLPNLQTIEGDVRITDNGALSTCDVNTFLGRVGVTGDVSCGGNVADCVGVCQ